jgi:hypothetical protein
VIATVGCVDQGTTEQTTEPLLVDGASTVKFERVDRLSKVSFEIDLDKLTMTGTRVVAAESGFGCVEELVSSPIPARLVDGILQSLASIQLVTIPIDSCTVTPSIGIISVDGVPIDGVGGGGNSGGAATCKEVIGGDHLETLFGSAFDALKPPGFEARFTPEHEGAIAPTGVPTASFDARQPGTWELSDTVCRASFAPIENVRDTSQR